MPAITSANTTLEYFDGFDDYSTAQIPLYWPELLVGSPRVNFSSRTFDSIPIISAGNGRNGTASLRVPYNNRAVSITLPPVATRTVGMAVKLSNFSVPTGFIGFLDVLSVQVNVSYNGDGTLSVYRANTVLATSTQSLSPGVYYYIEFSATINNSTGSYTLKVNGATWLTASSQNTRATSNNTTNSVALGQFGGDITGPNIDFDDFYSRADGTFCGDGRVESKLPTGDGASSQWTKSTGATNFGTVDENPFTDDTDYNASSAANDIDQYTYPALLTTTGTIQALMTVPILRVDTAGVATLASSYRVSSTNYVGGIQNIGATTYSPYVDIQGWNPNTSALWTISGVNGAQFGVKRLT